MANTPPTYVETTVSAPLANLIKTIEDHPEELISSSSPLMKMFLSIEFNAINSVIDSNNWGFIVSQTVIMLSFYAKFYSNLYVFDLATYNHIIQINLVVNIFGIFSINYLKKYSLGWFYIFINIISIYLLLNPINSIIGKLIVFYAINYEMLRKITVQAKFALI